MELLRPQSLDILYESPRSSSDQFYRFREVSCLLFGFLTFNDSVMYRNTRLFGHESTSGAAFGLVRGEVGFHSYIAYDYTARLRGSIDPGAH